MEIVDVNLTPEMLAAIGDCIAIEPDSVMKYTPKSFRKKKEDGTFLIPQSSWTVFELKIRNALDDIASASQFGTGPGYESRVILQIVAESVRSWKNLVIKEKGKVSILNFDPSLHVKDGKLTEETMKHFKSDLVKELFVAITHGTEMSEEELLGLN